MLSVIISPETEPEPYVTENGWLVSTKVDDDCEPRKVWFPWKWRGVNTSFKCYVFRNSRSHRHPETGTARCRPKDQQIQSP